MRRMMLMAASCPSKRLAAVTIRTLCWGVGCGVLHVVAWVPAKLGQTPRRPVQPSTASTHGTDDRSPSQGHPSKTACQPSGTAAVSVNVRPPSGCPTASRPACSKSVSTPAWLATNRLWLLVAVPRVAHDGVPQVAEMKPNLVKTPCQGPALHHAVPRGFIGPDRVGEFNAGEGAVMGLGLLRQRVVCGRQGLLHHAFVLCPASNHGVVGLGRASVHKLEASGHSMHPREARTTRCRSSACPTGERVATMHRVPGFCSGGPASCAARGNRCPCDGPANGWV